MLTLTRSLPDMDRDVVTCRCGLHYLAGDGKPADPYLSAAYDPIMNRLDECSVCKSEESVI